MEIGELETLSNNLTNLCRVCLKACNEEFGVRNVFGELKQNEISDDLLFVYEILSNVTAVQISKGDGFPVLVCKNCMAELHIAYKFKRKYEESNKIICKYLENKDSSKEECEIKLQEILPDLTNSISIEKIIVDPNYDDLEINRKSQIIDISVMENKKITHTCAGCKVVFQTVELFNNHTCNLDQEQERKLCQVCGTCVSRRYFKSHIQTHSGQSDFLCCICSKTYRSAMSLKFHVAKHTGEKPYLCSLCGKRFIQPTTFKYHMRFHNNERPYKCNYCDRTFVIQSHLVEHERTHIGLKPFVCYICSKTFTRKVDLRLHVFLHIGEKSLACRVCQKKFVRKSHLKLHEMVHSGKRPNCCEFCGKKFKRRKNLVCHIKTVHIDENTS